MDQLGPDGPSWLYTNHLTVVGVWYVCPVPVGPDGPTGYTCTGPDGPVQVCPAAFPIAPPPWS